MKKKCQCYNLNGEGGGSPCLIEDIHTHDGLVWLDMGVGNVSKILDQFDHKPPLVKEVLSAKEPRPRAIIQGDSLLASFRGVNLNAGSNPEDMVSVRVWISGNVIVTSHKRKLLAIKELEQSLANGTGPKNSAEFLEMLLALLIEKTSDVVSKIGDALDAIGDNLTEAQSQNGRSEVNEMRRRIIQLRRYLAPQREALTRIQPSKLSWLDETHLMHMREVTDSCTRVLEDMDSERERATVLYEEFFALSQEVINQKMYLLTIVAVIFMPLSFLTGLLGINVGGIPGAEYRYGFIIVCLILFFTFLGQWWFLRRRRWV